MSKYLVTANVLRVRSGPGISHAIIGALLRNAIVQGDEINGDWIHVTPTDNKTGWCHRGFLELLDETPPAPTQGTSEHAYDYMRGIWTMERDRQFAGNMRHFVNNSFAKKYQA